jgi:NADH-quinone oxidoreductase subunit G
VKSEIGIDGGADIRNNYSGNLVDICPVGAITDGDFRFKTRVWFLKNGRSVCPRCSRGCNIFIQSVRGYPLPGRQRKTYRFVPAENPEVNGYWICDFGRYGYHDIDDNRATAITVNGSDPAARRGADWDGILNGLAAELGAMAGAGAMSRAAVVLNSFLTNEELAACRKIFVEALGIQKIFFADPKPGEGDGYLLTADRAPNGRGAAALGYMPRLPDLEALAGSIDMLLVFGPYLLDHVTAEKAAAALGGIKSKVLFTAHASGLDAVADLVLPTALAAEKKGSFTNIEGIRQSFECAVAPLRGSLPESVILARLAGALGVTLG